MADNFIRNFDRLYIKQEDSTTPVDTFANMTGYTLYSNIREKASASSDKANEITMGSGNVLVVSEKVEFSCVMNLTKSDYTALLALKNKKVNLVLVDSEGELTGGAHADCVALFGVMIYPSLSIVGNDDCKIEIKATKNTGNINNTFRLVSVTLS